MKSIVRAFRNAPKRTAVLVALAGVVAAPVMAFAQWGPASRVTFTQANPADYVTFNSITNNAKYGDERNFVQVSGPGTNGKYAEQATLTDGGKYQVMVFFHNNAAANLKLTAENTRMIADLPATVAKGKTEAIEGTIKADNAKHLAKDGKNLGNEVWDDATLKATDGNYKITITPRSAKITSNGAVNGQTVSDSLYTETGAPIGYNALDGKLPGCYEFAGYVVFEFTATRTDKPEQPKNTEVCDLETDTIVTIDEKDFDSKMHSRDLADCGKVEVCRIEDKQIVSVSKQEAKDSRYTTDMSQCGEAPVTPETPSDDTPAVETPTELPQTGMVSSIAGVLGLGAVAAATTYFLRRNA